MSKTDGTYIGTVSSLLKMDVEEVKKRVADAQEAERQGANLYQRFAEPVSVQPGKRHIDVRSHSPFKVFCDGRIYTGSEALALIIADSNVKG